MTEFDRLKNGYITVIQFAFASGVSKQDAKHGNDVLHKFCETLVDNSNYLDSEKHKMKEELSSIKHKMDLEIEIIYKD